MDVRSPRDDVDPNAGGGGGWTTVVSKNGNRRAGRTVSRFINNLKRAIRVVFFAQYALRVTTTRLFRRSCIYANTSSNFTVATAMRDADCLGRTGRSGPTAAFVNTCRTRRISR